MKKIKIGEFNTKKAGPLEETWMERHQKRAGHKCDLVVKESSWPPIYICATCGKGI
jgi:hypothetical protein